MPRKGRRCPLAYSNNAQFRTTYHLHIQLWKLAFERDSRHQTSTATTKNQNSFNAIFRHGDIFGD